MRRDPAPGFSMLLFGVSLACYSPSLKSVQDQAYTAAVVLEGKVQSVAAPPPAGGGNDSRGGAGPAGGVLVKVLDLWPLNSGGLQREQLISVGSKAPCFKVKRNHRYIFFLEPTEEPLVFRTAFAPLDTSGKNLKRDVARILCADCAVPPKLKKLKSPNVHVGEKISLKCEATAGNPQPSYKWFKDGKELKKSKDIRIKYGNGKKISRLQFNKVKLEDAGEYSCEAENVLGKDTAKGSLNVRSDVQMDSSDRDVWRNCLCDCTCQILSKVSDRIHRRPVSAFRNGQLLQSVLRQYGRWLCHVDKNRKSTRRNKEGEMSEKRIAHSLRLKKVKEAEELYQKRVLTITGICVALLVVGIVCVVAYCKTKKQRKQMHNHLRQNMCPAHQNRSLANGPSHPRLDPEEIQMADYISKNVSATEHVIRRETETTFSGSHSCSPSHHCSTATPTSSQRHESHTWSLERTESLTSDSQSGIMLSSVGTSKCNSPACVEARARRGAAFCIEDSRRPMMQYRDSVDSLRDSPHSERYVSALTTPARLSPVDFHYSMATQVPTFEITSPNSAHAVSLPPAAPISFRVEEQQPLLRRYQLPFQDTQRYDSYYQRKTYLNDSMGSLPSSPFRITEDDEYETTQEYVTALEQPKKTASSNKRWKKSKLNGHVPHRARAVRDSFSLSSASYSESDEELVAESTPFLSTQNNETMNTESPPLHRPGDSRTYHSYSRHSAHGESGRSSLAHTTPKQDPDPL
ncbi:pro-neuregulin-2, membrane-bound isoform isoform X2 [Anas acuta]|uniref:pro-neuregulin-2, membrane-bound isoform isoform X2 n=1 Tax=Anas acuta TaxID=28680 RepID=UPI0018D74319|nr:pro-neuregulin-2, membrane-bound isoform isoform X3 [Anas platyrhynchos]